MLTFNKYLFLKLLKYLLKFSFFFSIKIILNFLYNYFDGLIKLFSDLPLLNFLDILIELFFSCMYDYWIILLYCHISRLQTLRSALSLYYVQRINGLYIACVQIFQETSLNLHVERRTTQIKFRRAISWILAAGKR